MKILALGDTHGRVLWKDIVQKEQDYDKIIFIGDYFDSREGVSPQTQLENFRDILEFKKNNMDKVVLLLGNHDFHYLKEAQEKYSQYQMPMFNLFNDEIQPAVEYSLVQVCFVHGNYVFTHAGVTKTWATDYNIDINDLENSINTLLLENPSAFRFHMGTNFSNSGDDKDQSPIWVRIPSLLADPLPEVTYIVGHTTLLELTMIQNLIGIDTLGTTGEYLIIEDNVPRAEKL